MSWLKQIVIDTNKPVFSIISGLRENLQGMQPGRDRSVVHASDITKTDFCPRKWAFDDLAGITAAKEGWVSAALSATFMMGSMTADLVIKTWAKEMAVGNWVCRRCNGQRTMSKQPPDKCNKSLDCIWEYREVQVVSVSHGVSGSMDVLFDVGAPKLMMTELKIMAPEEFAAIACPLPEHRLRTALYLRLIADSDFAYKDRINLHEGRVLYVSRGYGKKNTDHNGEILPFREFVVKRDDDSIGPILQKADQLNQFRLHKLMPSGICNTSADKVAQKCSSCSLCFSGQFPPQQESLL